MISISGVNFITTNYDLLPNLLLQLDLLYNAETWSMIFESIASNMAHLLLLVLTHFKLHEKHIYFDTF